jgi:hypothetical protein
MSDWFPGISLFSSKDMGGKMSCLLLFGGGKIGTKIKLSTIDEGRYDSKRAFTFCEEWDCKV